MIAVWSLAPGVCRPPEDERNNDAENRAPCEEQPGRRNSDQSNRDHNERDHQPRDSPAHRDLADIDLRPHTASSSIIADTEPARARMKSLE